MTGKEKFKAGIHGLVGVIVPSAIALLVFTSYAVITEITDFNRLTVAVWLGVFYLIAVTVVTIILKPKIDLETKESSLHPLLGEIMLTSMSSVSYPALIAESGQGKIIWYNKASKEEFKRTGPLRGCSVGDVLSFTEQEEKVYAAYFEKIYSVDKKPISAGDGDYILYSLADITELENTKKRLEERTAVVAYVMVDNLDELLRHEQEEYRNSASAAEKVLRTWAAEANGILKEYQHDRYIFIFEAEMFYEFEKHGFDVLDKVRSIRVGEGSIPITVSIGIYNGEGTLAEKEKGAQAALETALQRGGDQAVVKNRDGTQSIYGGRTKTVQKKTKVRARTVANELLVLISEASNVIIMGHKRPDFDAFGACIGVAKLAEFCGVKANIVTDFSYSGIEKCLDRIKDEGKYNAVLVNREAAVDMVTPDTLLVIADVNNPAVYEEPLLAESCEKLVIIDHHRKTAEFTKEPIITYIEPSASATCELVCEMLEQVLPDEMLLPCEADLLFAGILLDTNQFKKNTGTRTFSAALYLKDRGADISTVQEFFKTSLAEYERENKFRSNVFIYRDTTAISVGNGIGDTDDSIPASRAADKLLELEGIKASFVLIRIKDAIHVSARSVGTINVQLILEELRGGGHFDSAGAQIKDMSMDEVVDMLKAAIDKYLDTDMTNKITANSYSR